MGNESEELSRSLFSHELSLEVETHAHRGLVHEFHDFQREHNAVEHCIAQQHMLCARFDGRIHVLQSEFALIEQEAYNCVGVDEVQIRSFREQVVLDLAGRLARAQEIEGKLHAELHQQAAQFSKCMGPLYSEL